jgi:hypothetical protein
MHVSRGSWGRGCLQPFWGPEHGGTDGSEEKEEEW